MNLLEFFGLGRLSVSWGPLDDRWYSNTIGRRTTAGVNVDEDTAKNYSVVWACTRLLCGTGASLPLNVYQPLGGGGKAVARLHQVQRLIHTAPNTSMGSMQFRSLGIDRQVNRGNFYAEIDRDAFNRAAALWPIHPTRIPNGGQMSDAGRIAYEVKNDKGEPTVIDGADMLHVPSIITKDGVNGIGVITAARESVGFGLGTERHGAAFFGNGARPSVVLKHPGKIRDPEQREELRRQWNEIHGGPGQSGKVALLQEGMDVTPFSISNNDSQFLETRQHNVEEVARWYGVPPHLVGHLLRSTYNNIDVQGTEFVIYSLLPWLKLWEEEINRKLLTEEEQDRGLYCKHVLDGLLRGDTAARTAFYKAMREIGVYSANDIAELEDRNPIGPLGDIRIVSTSMTSLEALAKAADEPKPAPMFPTPPVVDEEEEPTDDDEQDEGEDTLRMIADRYGVLVAQQATLHLDVIEGVVNAVKQLPAPTVNQVSKPVGIDSSDALAAAYACLDDTVQRFLSKEQNAARRAAGSGRKFFEWLDPFYERHQALMAEACRGPIRVILSLEGKPDQVEEFAAKFAATHVEESRRELLTASECQEGELAGRVDLAIEAWKESRRVVFTGQEKRAA